MKWVGILVLVAFALSAGAGSPQKDPTKPKESGPMEIDCSPLDKATSTKYKLTVVVRSEDGACTPIPITLENHPKSPQVALTIDSALPEGWNRSRDGNKVTIRAYKGSPVKSITITLHGEVQALAPTIRRLPPKTKK